MPSLGDMKTLMTLLVFIPMAAMAQTPTVGCYVAQGQSSCAVGTLTCGTTYTSNLLAHGSVVAGVCQAVIECAAEANTCAANYAGMTKNRDEWAAYAKVQVALAKRLKSACGTRCRKIK